MTRWEAKTPEELQASADEFEREYATGSGTKGPADKMVQQLRALGRVVKSCDCGEAFCKGWQSVNKESWDEDQKFRGSHV